MVEAGAGSGKTTSLASRMVALIADGKTTIERIAALTFTRKAASELKGKFQIKLDVFHDIQPVAPVHLLLIPKAHVESLYDATPQHAGVLGKIMTLAGRLARENGAGDGFRLIVNTGRVGRQEVMHVHVHVVGGGEPFGPMIVRKGH